MFSQVNLKKRGNVMNKYSENDTRETSVRLSDYLLNCNKWNTEQLVGKSLTLIEGAIHDEVARKAVKDMMKHIIYESNSYMVKEIYFTSGCLSKKLNEPEIEKSISVERGNIFD